MNRQRRRTQARLGQVNLIEITFPWQMTVAECAMMAEDRMANNYLQTKHPYHHLTANYVIVEPDPTLEYYLKRLEREDQATITRLKAKADTLIAQATTVPKAMPVNRKFYGHDPYARH